MKSKNNKTIQQYSNRDLVHFESLYPSESRFSEIEKILDFVKKGNSCQLISLPGGGKSNLLGLLSYNRNVRKKHLGENQGKFHFVYMDFSEVKNRSFLDVNKFIFLSLIDSLKERQIGKEHETLFKIFKESLKLNDELVLFQGLKEAIDFLAIENLTVVFLFDMFKDYIPSLSKDFFTNLRALRNRAKYKFSAVFSLERPLDEIVEPQILSDFYEFVIGNTVFLPLLDITGMEFRVKHLEKITGKKINKKIYEEVIKLTAGHGKLTRLALEATVAENKDLRFKIYELTEFLLKRRTIKSTLLEIWNSLSPQEQKSLLQIYDLPVHQSLGEGGRFKIYEDLKYLEHVGLVKNGNIAIPLFKEYLEENQTLLRQGFERARKISFNKKTNEILKGEGVISDKLTSLEFKLLSFLLENEGKIVSREDVINAVWKESASTAGVTDQAIDQLVLRLRKKIEDNPNEPTHLQTLKGLGFKFMT